MARKRAVGEGSIYRRQDGRYEVAIYSLTTAGTRKRIRGYAATRAEADEKLTALKRQIQQGIPLPDKTWKLGAYLDYWLEQVVHQNRRPATYERYEIIARLYLKPSLGGRPLSRLTVPIVQTFLNRQLGVGQSLRNVQIIREVLSSALTRAMREELVSRNVARLVELPTWERDDIVPWTSDEARRFLESARGDALHAAFVLLMLCGLRRGEVLGLRWSDVAFDEGTLRIRQQVQRTAGELRVGPVKTRAGKRTLPLLELVRSVLIERRSAQVDAQRLAGSAWHGFAEDQALVFTSRTGHPIEPRNLVRSFQLICTRHGIRIIRVHDIRHTTATLLKDLGVPVRDAQLILGHSTVAITQEIYQHDSLDSRRAALQGVEALLTAGGNGNEGAGLESGATSSLRSRQVASYSRQKQPSKQGSDVEMTSLQSVIHGRGSRTRTYDTRFWSTADPTIQQGWGDIRSLLQHCTRFVLLGVVAVNSSRQNVVLPKRSAVRRSPLLPAAGLHTRAQSSIPRRPLSVLSDP
jgi:integrase